MPLEIGAFYLVDHRLIGLAMVALLLAAGVIGYRLGSARVDAPDALRSLMSLSLIHILRCPRSTLCRSLLSPYH